MASGAWLITSNSHGDPFANSSIGHFVGFSSDPARVVNQMTAGGRFPSYDCAPAVLRSAALNRGRDVPVRTIEQWASTGPPVGTGWAGLLRAATALGLQPTRVLGGDPDPGVWIMNPAMGALLNPGAFPYYLAASQHQRVEFEAPWGAVQTGVTSPTTGTPVTPVSLLRRILMMPDPNSSTHAFIKVLFRDYLLEPEPTPQQLADYTYLYQTQGEEAVVSAIFDSAEAKAVLAAKRRVLAL